MKHLPLLTLCVTLLSACGVNLYPQDFNAAEDKCGSNEGLTRIWIERYNDTSNVMFVKCNNGAEFTLKGKL